MAGLNVQRLNFGYSQSRVCVYKDEVLGMGSFGTVYKAKVDDFICAAKTPHFQLTSGHGADSATVARRFQQEFDFLSSLRHPNIVQYLGMYEDSATKLPLLLMELMNDANLTQFLDDTSHPLPFHLEVNICHDVSKAMAYLHSHKVVHRDLSGSNVLLIGDALKAKICDFGMAKLLEINPSHRQSLTVCPGNAAYMPPEALRDSPKYDDKLDCFSFGVLIVQVLTCLFPQPSDRNEVVSDGHGGDERMKLVPEVGRRQNHISLVDPHNPLLRIALECLKDDTIERPSAHQLCEKVGTLKISTPYRESDVNSTSSGPAVIEPRQKYPSVPVRERSEHLQESGELWREIRSLKEQLRQKDLLLEDVFVNAQVQDRILAETRTKVEEEKIISGMLRQQLSENHKDDRQIQLELSHVRKQCVDLSHQMEQECRTKEAEIDRLRHEGVQTRRFLSVLQQQFSEVEESERMCRHELSLTTEELTKTKHDQNEDKLRDAAEIEQLAGRLHELTKERDSLNVRLRETSIENSQLRDEVDQRSRDQEAASERILEKDSLIRDLQRRLDEASRGTFEHRSTSLKQILPPEDSWNIPRDEVTIFHDKEIGRGGNGVVIEGRYQTQRVAVKQIHEDILYNKAVVDEFKREVRIMANIQHPNLVRFIAAVFDDENEAEMKSPLLVLEFLQTDLRKAYQKGDVESQYQKISIFRDVAYGLHYLHEHQEPIVHRDVSAANVLLEALHGSGGTCMWRAKLSDFGSANFLTQAKSFGVGAIVYSAPEMYPREDPKSPMPRPTTKCDVFSYGIVIIEVVSRIMPTTMNRHLLFTEVESRWPSMYDLVSRCTKSSPNDRPSMCEVLNCINRIPIARPRNRSLRSQSSQSSLETSSWNSSIKE